MSSKKAGRKATQTAMTGIDDILKSAPSLVAAAQSDKSAENAVKAAAAPSRDMTRGEAFRYARMAAKAAGLDPSKQTFTHGGKTYNTRMAGEGAKKPASSTPTRSTVATPAKSEVSASTRKFLKGLPTIGSTISGMRSNAPTQGRGTPPATPTTRKTPVNAGRSEGFLSRFGKSDTGKSFKERQEQKYGKPSGRSVLLTGKEAREANKRQGTIGGYAKGGKIDGCAIRGKTRAPMKKGK